MVTRSKEAEAAIHGCYYIALPFYLLISWYPCTTVALMRVPVAVKLSQQQNELKKTVLYTSLLESLDAMLMCGHSIKSIVKCFLVVFLFI